MAWSTRQLAELAGTTLKAVRHYHKVGLLDEPERDSNGYKRYGVAHLTRLLRIRRLTDLGVSLPQIAAMGEADEHPEEALKVLDAELAATIDRLHRIRAELALILRSQLPTDLPPELAPTIDNLSEADRSMMVVYGRVLAPSGMDAMRRMIAEHPRTPAATEFDNLPADADEDVRRELAERFLPEVIDIAKAFPDVITAHQEAPGGHRQLSQTVGLAIADIYNAAQLDVLARVGQELNRRAAEAAAEAGDADH
ncbi:MerR family transcriptional regulator [Microlunatus speluncae]|uniref:helix-turn-helix domain-containing protein n=1 Tax=Microlunatus speluncae TaxID=2594267 RepID=UPI001266223D|nr:MerR family transcriptional regulator [Microlunatus speluncae]